MDNTIYIYCTQSNIPYEFIDIDEVMDFVMQKCRIVKQVILQKLEKEHLQIQVLLTKEVIKFVANEWDILRIYGRIKKLGYFI
jgi:hypothetical protein